MAKTKPKLPKLTLASSNQREAVARLREAILHISARCFSADYFGATKLNKILAFADFTSFARYGAPITGVEYMRQKNGPVPRRMKPVLAQMRREGEIAVQEIPIGRFVEHRPVALRPAVFEHLSARDVALLDEIIDLTWKATGQQVSEFSHGRAWEVAGQDGVTIPYEAALLGEGKPSAAQIARTHELNERFHWE